MRYLSVCSGIEAASVAWEPLGWTPVGFAEIEAFPSAVLKHRFKDRVHNFGDMTAIDHGDVGPFEVLVGGTPCQGWSGSGLQLSFADPRAQLAFNYVRIAHEAQALRYFVWENVPKVLRAKDNAFGQFLGRLVGGDTIDLPPERIWWPDAGLVSGPWGRVAWRVLDSQYFGVPQRRPRVYVIGCPSGGGDPAAVLFERGCRAGDVQAHPRAPAQHEALVEAHGRSDTLALVSGARSDRDVREDGQRRSGDRRAEDRPSERPRTGRVDAGIQGVHGAFTKLRGSSDPVFYSGFDTPLSMTAAALRAHDGSKSEMGVILDGRLRRFTPLERERLQGFPDDWTAIPWRGKKPDVCPEGPRAAALGNSMPVPVMTWLGERIAADAARGELRDAA